MKKNIKTLKVLSIKLGRPFLPIAHLRDVWLCASSYYHKSRELCSS